jgi:hypothetical protein
MNRSRMAAREITPELADQITRLREVMISVHYFNEARWLEVATDPSLRCRSASARTGLAEAKSLARELGFAHVAEWLASQLPDATA